MAKLAGEDVVTLETLARKGVANREIARLLGVTEDTVRYQLRRRACGAADGRARSSPNVSNSGLTLLGRTCAPPKRPRRHGPRTTKRTDSWFAYPAARRYGIVSGPSGRTQIRALPPISAANSRTRSPKSAHGTRNDDLSCSLLRFLV
jgi:hypothetical protein